MFDLRVFIICYFSLGDTQKNCHHNENVSGDLHPDNEVNEKNTEEHPAICRKTLHKFVRTDHHISAEQKQPDKAEIENKAEIADVGCHIITTVVRANVVYVPAIWILKVAITNNPSVKVVGKNNHIP